MLKKSGFYSLAAVVMVMIIFAPGCPSSMSPCEDLEEKTLVCMTNACYGRNCDFCNICVMEPKLNDCINLLGPDAGTPFDCDDSQAQEALKTFICDPFDRRIALDLCPGT